ncbi:fructose-bisphosphatase class III [Streptococcus parauberis]|uniref:Fructose-1,6-bisphosphatase class 3 n=1 Tax=Streptococcus parauberis KRS-02083 TaxID=1207545 RepID=A0ABN0ITW5_9STRE|nr:fructose-bisphosphatase class III [Streptococcus parauberis]AUT05647.1 Fructose-bisphosphatase [Streptococcus parauberis]EMG26330.1 Fructose-1,6-bisphosphatase [Streptococcus parauberis KRS-02083]MDT2748150.1 fructose-bisphosphatase class III [Streptococcus parauberis]ONH63990.1 Fructose-1,6-bisphosphatase class 3 [Streptococcus parauberis]PCH11061.1 Fructose-1,6-bisphosphatase class 3 [Streptococcus parauberis]
MSNYYQLLKEKFPSKSSLVTEMINLDAICHLPKGTEHFLSDLHGEYEAFDYLLRNGSGSIKKKVAECFTDRTDEEIEFLCQYIYYPKEKIEVRQEVLSSNGLIEELTLFLPDLLQLVKYIGGKYTRSKVRKMMAADYAYIMEELLIVEQPDENKISYYNAIISKVIELDQLDDLFIAFATLIQDLSIDHLHVVGDIFDRGKYPDLIIDRLQKFNKIDIQWGNHDITWIGAVSGSTICMINVIRIAARYNSIALIEDRYGINLRSLIEYAQKNFEPEEVFNPILDGDDISESDKVMLNKLQQATANLQFKLEHQLIARRPDFDMQASNLFTKINREEKTIEIKGKTYPLQSFPYQMIDWESPEQLTDEEERILSGLMHRFQTSNRLNQQIDFLMENGSIYKVTNNNLLFHGGMPMHSNGDFKSMRFGNQVYCGKDLMNFFQKQVIKSYKNKDKHDDFETDLFWYLWCGEVSSLFGKDRMTTFERYYIADKETHVEIKNAYYQLREREDICLRLLNEFGLDETAHIVNGHTPVKEKVGEIPIKANGRIIIIDGGLAKGYQKKTGIAGYTLISNSYGLELVAHKPFSSVEDVLEGKCDIIFIKRLVEEVSQRTLVKETDNGKAILKEISELDYLFHHFDLY